VRRREAGPGVPGPELVVRTLAAPQEPGQATRLAQRRQAIVPAGEDLPGVALMAHVPHDLVAGRVEAVPQRHGQLDYAQAGADVTAGLRDDVDQPAAHLVRERLELVARQALDVRRTYDRLKERHGALSSAHSVWSRYYVMRQLRQRRRNYPRLPQAVHRPRRQSPRLRPG